MIYGVQSVMSKPYRLVVFDWEGTLGDTLGQVLNIVASEARRLNFGDLDEGLAREYVVLGLVMAVKKLYPLLSSHDHQTLLDAVQTALMRAPQNISLIPGAETVVKQLHQAGIDIAVATNKGQRALLRALEATGLHAYFQVTRSAGQSPPKPCPQMLEEIMATFGVSPSETLMVGDSVIDMDMAREAQVDAVGVDFYHQQASNLLAAGAKEVFDDYKQLASYLQLPESR